MGVRRYIGSAILLPKIWDGEGLVSFLTYYGIVAIDKSHGGNIQHCTVLSNNFQGNFSPFYL
jgi:hypothetical protein